MDEQQSKDANKENNGNTANMTEKNNPDEDCETNKDSQIITEDVVDCTQTKVTERNDKSHKILNNSKLVEKFKTQMAIPDAEKLDDETQIKNNSPEKMTENNSNSEVVECLKKSAVKRPKGDRKKHKKSSKKRKISYDDGGRKKSDLEEIVQNDESISSEQTTVKTVNEISDTGNNLPIEIASSRTIPKRGKKRKEMTKIPSDDVFQKLCSDINGKLDWIKEHIEGLETFVFEKLTSICENWKQVAHAQSTSAADTALDITNINRPPAVGYVRIDNNTIHLGQGVWLAKKTYDDLVYGATTNAMFVKNIAMAVYGTQYLKEHNVKGKACNKTKKHAKTSHRSYENSGHKSNL